MGGRRAPEGLRKRAPGRSLFLRKRGSRLSPSWEQSLTWKGRVLSLSELSFSAMSSSSPQGPQMCVSDWIVERGGC